MTKKFRTMNSTDTGRDEIATRVNLLNFHLLKVHLIRSARSCWRLFLRNSKIVNNQEI